MGKGKHFIGDFLPPEELEKFMETFKALKVSFPPQVHCGAWIRTSGVSFWTESCEDGRVKAERKRVLCSRRKAVTPTTPSTKSSSWRWRIWASGCWWRWAGRRVKVWAATARESRPPLTSMHVCQGQRKRRLSPLSSFVLIPPSLSCCFPSLSVSRGVTASNGAGFGIDRPAELTKADDEYDAFRKRMMLAYRFRPNPLVRPASSPPQSLPRIHVKPRG